MWGEEARLWGMPWSMHCPGQEWVEQRQVRKIKGAGVMTAASSLTTYSQCQLGLAHSCLGCRWVFQEGWRDRWMPASWLLIWVAGTHQAAPLDKGTEANLPQILPGVI